MQKISALWFLYRFFENKNREGLALQATATDILLLQCMNK